jgi:hypothetical protein
MQHTWMKIKSGFLILRKWKADYFYPLGMKKEKAGPFFFLTRNYQKPQRKNLGSGLDSQIIGQSISG